MTSALRVLRRRVLTPDVAETRLDVRGFHVKNPAARDLLENIGRSFLTGYGHAAQARCPADAQPALDAVPVQFRGFAHEGAAMAFAVLDGLPVPGSDRLRRFLAGGGASHCYMVYVGVGWAMARLPRWRWRALHAPDPLLRWLVLDGYGFHQAYFHTSRYVAGQQRDVDLAWPADGPRWYRPRVVDQGIGRAMWFVAGTDPARVVALLRGFAPHRHADLYAGVGLAATYAGGAGEAELRVLLDGAGEHRVALAQGSAFAAEARLRAGLETPHTAVATGVFCGMPPHAAAALTTELRPTGDAGDDGDLPAYEVWRQAVAAALTSGRPIW